MFESTEDLFDASTKVFVSDNEFVFFLEKEYDFELEHGSESSSVLQRKRDGKFEIRKDGEFHKTKWSIPKNMDMSEFENDSSFDVVSDVTELFTYLV